MVPLICMAAMLQTTPYTRFTSNTRDSSRHETGKTRLGGGVTISMVFISLASLPVQAADEST